MKYHSIPDKELIILLSSSNDENAFQELYIRYKDKIWSYCFSFLKSEEETDDLVQEVFIHLWEFRKFINPELSFSSFIYTMTRNRVFNFFRDADVVLQVKKALSQKISTEENNIEAELIFSEYQQILTKAIELLPPQKKKIFNMSRLESMSHKEIALKLGISVNTVQEHISGSLRFIKTYFEQHADITICMFILALIY